jgi:endonuclease-8
VPEGDSIHRLAATLRPRLVGGRVLSFNANEIADAVAETVVGHTVVAVEARGKNLLVRFDDGRALHVHLRMLGRVRLEQPRSAYWRPRRTAHQLRLDVDGAVVVGDRIPVLRLLRAGAGGMDAIERAPDLRSLGPDLNTPELDEAECVARLRALGRRPIGEALLLQRALAGIGNIYKSETLFLEKVHPSTPVADLADATLEGLVRRASALLKANLGKGPRVTRNSLAGPRFWVYGRRGRACFRCAGPGQAIDMIRQGAPPGRSTYYCRRCQTAAPA